MSGDLRIDNGRVALALTRQSGKVVLAFSARTAAGSWREVCASFLPDFAAHPAGNRFFDTAATPRRFQLSQILSDFALVRQDPDQTVVRVWGTQGATRVEETLRLRAGRGHFEVEVRAELDEPTLDYLMQSFAFALPGCPEFVHSPTAKLDDPRSGPARDQVIGDHAFHAPALILQQGGLFAALVPDLDLINRHPVPSPDARRTQQVARNRFSVPIEDDKYTLPTALDLNVRSGLTDRPVFSFGMMDFVVGHHVRYQRRNDASMQRQLGVATLCFGFDLFLGADERPGRGYQGVARHQWQRYGRPLARRPHLPLSPEQYVRTIYGVVCRPMDPEVQAPVPGYRDCGVFLDFALEGLPVGGMVDPLGVLGFGDALWNFEFWNNVRDASGMWHWGQRLALPGLVDRARRIVNLALCAPQNEAGFFCLVYRAAAREWRRSTLGPSPEPTSFFAHEEPLYDVPAMSKTAAHLLEYYRQCEPDPRIPAYLRPYAEGMLERIGPDGLLPSYYTPGMQPCEALRFSAQPAATLWFLAEFAQASGEGRYLAGARRVAGFLLEQILPGQRWIDLEPYYSCGRNPLSLLADQEQGLPIRGNLSAFWAARGFAALYRATGEAVYLEAGEAVVDYICFSQACWAPHYIYTAYPFGGFTADNIDTATWLDARQCEMVAPFIWYGQTLGRQDLVERGLAAGRAAVVLINHPRHRESGIYRHPNYYGFGLGPENINHEGHNQSAMRTHPSWGECSGIFTGLADADRLLGPGGLSL